tara:strand:+ start:157 stop:381 length:225 start_codon:yes stop_codon:yes gene_type:complete
MNNSELRVIGKRTKVAMCGGCGGIITHDESLFWGECQTCRPLLPIQTSQTGDTQRSFGQSEREYHGGLHLRGEW